MEVTVKDATGALVPGATVEITNSETNVTSTAITNNSGYYEVPYLLPGGYTLSAMGPSLLGLLRGVVRATQAGVARNAEMQVDTAVGAALGDEAELSAQISIQREVLAEQADRPYRLFL